MKMKLASLLCALGFWLLIGCGGGAGGSSPGDVVKKYTTAMIKGDMATALTCIDPAKRKQAEKILELGVTVAAGFASAEGGLDSVTILNEDVQGDRARVGYQSRTKKGVERRASANAEKINGTWYVAP